MLAAAAATGMVPPVDNALQVMGRRDLCLCSGSALHTPTQRGCSTDDTGHGVRAPGAFNKVEKTVDKEALGQVLSAYLPLSGSGSSSNLWRERPQLSCWRPGARRIGGSASAQALGIPGVASGCLASRTSDKGLPTLELLCALSGVTGLS